MFVQHELQNILIFKTSPHICGNAGCQKYLLLASVLASAVCVGGVLCSFMDKKANVSPHILSS